MALNLSGTSGITGAGIGTIDASGSNVTGVVTCTSVVSSGAVSGTTGTFTGDVSIADKIIHTGDTDTAIRFSGADTVTVETAGAERLSIASDAAITTTQPNSGIGLIVKNSAHNSQLQILATASNKNSEIWFGDSGDGNIGTVSYTHLTLPTKA